VLGGSRRKVQSIFHGRLADSRIEADATALFGISNPVTLRASLPVQLERKRLQAGTALDRAKPFFLSLDCPALFLETLPNECALAPNVDS
jgi:hypothetical protein